MNELSNAPERNTILITRLREIVGDNFVLTSQSEVTPFVEEWRGNYRGMTPAVVQPSSPEQVSRIVTLCNDLGMSMVPQGGNTGLSGGQTPDSSNTQLILSTSRLNKVRLKDRNDRLLVAEAGVTLRKIQEEAQELGLFFPLSMISEQSCTIGGNLATNAGGTAVVRFGTARAMCLGLEVVLANGQIWNGLRNLKKDNTGYDLRDLFIGSEGTLGIITAVALHLQVRPRDLQAAFIAVRSPRHALNLFMHLQEKSGSLVTTFELIPQIGVDIAVKHGSNSSSPFDLEYPWYVLLEIAGGTTDGDLKQFLENVLDEAIKTDYVIDAVIAVNSSQRRKFWHLRESLSKFQRLEGATLNYDIAVPIADVPEFIEEAIEQILFVCPGSRPVAYGHVGDGNVHFNISQPIGVDPNQFIRLEPKISEIVFEIVQTMNGSISAEHGIGQLKLHHNSIYKSKVELDIMKKIKVALDPGNIFNPNKLLRFED